jgi:hypothetical protein
MIVRKNKDTGLVKSIFEYTSEMWIEFDNIYNKRVSSSSTVETVDISETAFITNVSGQRVVSPEYIRDVLEKSDC